MVEQRFRYWTRCVGGKFSVLYRFDRINGTFESLDGSEWLSSPDRYKRVTWDTDHLEIDAQEANLISTAIHTKEALPC